MHPQLQSFSKSRAVATVAFLVLLIGAWFVLLRDAEASLQELPELGFAEIFERQIQQAEHDLEASPEKEVLLRNALSSLFRSKGHFARAALQCEAAKGLAMEHEENELRVAALYECGLVSLERGRFQDARRDLESAAVLVDRKGDQAVLVLQALGTVRRELGHFPAAVELYWEAWRVGLDRDRLDSVLLPAVAANLGEAYAQGGEADLAVYYLKQAVEHQRELGRLLQAPLAPADPALASMYGLLGGAHHARGDALTGAGLYRKAAEMLDRLGQDAEAVGSRLGFARAQRDLGDASGALRSLDLTEAAVRAAGREGPELSRVLLMRAEHLRELGRHTEAGLAVEEASELQRKALAGEESHEMALVLNIQGSILHDQSELQGAQDKYMQALELNLRTVGVVHPETAATHNSLGALYEDAGDDRSASKQYRRCLEIQLATVGAASPEVANTYNNLATVFFRQGRLSEAERMLSEALQILDAAGVASGNPDRELYEENLAAVLKAQADGHHAPIAVVEEASEEEALVLPDQVQAGSGPSAEEKLLLSGWKAL